MLSLRILPEMPGPLPRRSRKVHLPVSSPASSAFPESQPGRLPASPRSNDFVADKNFEAADSSLCSGLPVCSPPRSFPPLRIPPQGSRGFYVRAEHASLPPHASDMLVVRIQAIDDTGTSTPQDPQPYRPLLTPVLACWPAVALEAGQVRRHIPPRAASHARIRDPGCGLPVRSFSGLIQFCHRLLGVRASPGESQRHAGSRRARGEIRAGHGGRVQNRLNCNGRTMGGTAKNKYSALPGSGLTGGAS